MTLGPFNLTISVLIWMLAAVAAITVHKFYARGRPDAQVRGSALANALLLWFLIWKLSQLLFSPASVLREPVGLLYFHGGMRGAWLAGAAAALYLAYTARKQAVPGFAMLDSTLVFLLGGYAADLLLRFVTGTGSRPTLGLLGLLAAAVLFRIYRGRKPTGGPVVLRLALLFLVGHAVISALGGNLWERTAQIAAASSTGLGIGQQAPDFELADLDGRPVKLSGLKGKTVALNFWATWCPPCRAEMPELQRFHENGRNGDAVILAVNATNTETGKEAVGRWLDAKGYTLPVLFDAGGEVANRYRIPAFPATYIIGPDGVIRGKIQGPMNESMLTEAVAGR